MFMTAKNVSLPGYVNILAVHIRYEIRHFTIWGYHSHWNSTSVFVILNYYFLRNLPNSSLSLGGQLYWRKYKD